MRACRFRPNDEKAIAEEQPGATASGHGIDI
jgi:hypothetical protein